MCASVETGNLLKQYKYSNVCLHKRECTSLKLGKLQNYRNYSQGVLWKPTKLHLLCHEEYLYII